MILCFTILLPPPVFCYDLMFYDIVTPPPNVMQNFDHENLSICGGYGVTRGITKNNHIVLAKFTCGHGRKAQWKFEEVGAHLNLMGQTHVDVGLI